MGASSAEAFRACSARRSRCAGRLLELLFLAGLAGEGLDDLDGLQAFLQGGQKVGLTCPDLLDRGADGLVDAQHERGEQRGDGQRNDREIPAQQEHHHDHRDQGQRVGQDGQCRGRRECLDGLHVAGQCAQQGADPGGVVVGQRQLLQVVIEPHPQFVADRLAQAFGQVAAGIHRYTGDRRDRHGQQCCGFGDMGLGLTAERRKQPRNPQRRWMITHDVVQDTLEWPRHRQRHRHLHQRRRQHSDDRSAVRPKQLNKKRRHSQSLGHRLRDAVDAGVLSGRNRWDRRRFDSRGEQVAPGRADAVFGGRGRARRRRRRGGGCRSGGGRRRCLVPAGGASGGDQPP